MVRPPATAAAPSSWNATCTPSKYHASASACTHQSHAPGPHVSRGTLAQRPGSRAERRPARHQQRAGLGARAGAYLAGAAGPHEDDSERQEGAHGDRHEPAVEAVPVCTRRSSAHVSAAHTHREASQWEGRAAASTNSCSASQGCLFEPDGRTRGASPTGLRSAWPTPVEKSRVKLPLPGTRSTRQRGNTDMTAGSRGESPSSAGCRSARPCPVERRAPIRRWPLHPWPSRQPGYLRSWCKAAEQAGRRP